MKRAEEEYLGDDIYASFDGREIKLRVLHADSNIWLDPDVFTALERYAKKCWGKANA
jgi:hypothetical protein